MYKHQVIGVRRAQSWRSRQSEHIVGICTLEAVNRYDQFAKFKSHEDWQAVGGKIQVTSSSKKPSKRKLTAKCRYWSLEEVVDAMRRSSPQHEFYTRDPVSLIKTSVYSFQGSNTHNLYTRNSLTGQMSPFNEPLFVEVGGKYKKACGTQWISTAATAEPDNLHSLPATKVPCPMHNCQVIPQVARPTTQGKSISRGDVPDC